MHSWYIVVGPDRYESLPEFDVLPPSEWPKVTTADVSMYMNHSCDPTCWFAFPEGQVTGEPLLMTATRDLVEGQCFSDAVRLFSLRREKIKLWLVGLA